MIPKPCPIYAEFLRDHPEYVGDQRVVTMPDGSEEHCVRIDALEAFVRWCLFNGHGDGPKVVKFLAETIPKWKAMERGRNGSGQTWGNGTGSAIG